MPGGPGKKKAPGGGGGREGGREEVTRGSREGRKELFGEDLEGGKGGSVVLYDLAVFLLLLMAITTAKAVPRVLREASTRFFNATHATDLRGSVRVMDRVTGVSNWNMPERREEGGRVEVRCAGDAGDANYELASLELEYLFSRLSWPHAPWMSSPRLRRIVTGPGNAASSQPRNCVRRLTDGLR